MDEKTLWKTVLAELQLALTPGSFQTLFYKSALVAKKKGVATIALANAQIKTMVEERYYAFLKEVIDRLTRENNSLVFEIIKEKPAASPPEFLSPHPTDVTRIRQIERWIPEALRYYQPAR